ncbi:hypothetical protein [Pseudomonas sp. KNUC1026]|uniref:hypothetical protein n=1 Tax=Pseudomonas sp. KNUC1026 TaxID=2893890 RepID=UPI001F238E5D|nr:hypothetical protein [Pseudomonas sp. KNUC1026]UFH48285.1 hypothetical protein LN139_14035 [Pseudomonas sp. KNUC1026]
MKHCLACILWTVAAMANVHAAEMGSITVYDEFNNGHILAPNPAPGWVQEYTTYTDPPAQGTRPIRAIRFKNLPSATTVFMSSDRNCARNANVDFWIELRTTSDTDWPLSDSPAAMEVLMNYPKGSVLNKGLLVSDTYRKAGNNNLDKLACVRISTSRLPGGNVPSVKAALVPKSLPYSLGSSDTCANQYNAPVVGDYALTANYHSYRQTIRCGNFPGLTVQPSPSTDWKSWQNVDFQCPAQQALVGLQIRHEAFTPSNNADFKATCSSLYDTKHRPLMLINDEAFEITGTSESHDFTCQTSQVVVGVKARKGGDFPSVGYRCATLLTYPDSLPSPANDTTGNPLQENNGSVTVIAPDNTRGYAFALPQAGRTVQYELRGYQAGLPYDENPDTRKIGKIILQGIPSASKVTVTSNPTCDTEDTNSAYSFTLRSTADGASTGEMNIEDFFAASEGSPIENRLMLESKRGTPNETDLPCIRLSVSRKPGDTVPATNVPLSTWFVTGDLSESGHDFTCSATQMLSGRMHEGDENGSTRYQCSGNGSIEVSETRNFENFNEKTGTWFDCPQDTVMVGRAHTGDTESGKTTYRCATVTYQKRPTIVELSGNWQKVSERKHDFSCPAGEALVGRRHKGDENGDTYYRCGRLKF